MRYRATTQVKVLSPGISVIPVAEAFPYAAGNILVTVMRGDANLAGSKSVGEFGTLPYFGLEFLGRCTDLGH